MANEKLISELSSYKKTKSLSNSQIEIDLGLPKNSLSNFLSGKKDIPKKWIEPITVYIVKGYEKEIAKDAENKLIQNNLSDRNKNYSGKPLDIKSYKEKLNINLGDLKDKVKTANEIPIPEKKNFNNENSVFNEAEINKQLERLKTLEVIEEFCNLNGITALELIEGYKSKVKGKKVATIEEKAPKNAERQSMSNWREKQRETKCGLNVK